MQPHFDPAEGFFLIEKYGVTLWGQIPTMFQLALEDASSAHADLSSVECIFFSGAPASCDLIRRLKKVCPLIISAYGMTETVGSVTWAIDCDSETLSTTVGFEVEDYPLRIASPEGVPVEDGSIGEIQVRGDFHFSSYWNNPQSTVDAFTHDRWLKTGDLGKKRKDGAIILSGRLKERFKSGGYNVYPREVEAAMLSAPSVAECIVVSVPDPVYFEVGHAFIMPVPEYRYCEDTLREHAAVHLANYKRPKMYHQIDTIPQLSNGKIDRRALQAMAFEMSGLGAE